MSEDELRDCPILILANKQDLENRMTIAELKDHLDDSEFRKRTINIIGTCALTGEGLHEAFEWLSRAILYPESDNKLLKPFNDTFTDVKNIANQIKINSIDNSWSTYLSNLSSKLVKSFSF